MELAKALISQKMFVINSSTLQKFPDFLFEFNHPCSLPVVLGRVEASRESVWNTEFAPKYFICNYSEY